MTDDPVSRIQILAPERLHALITHEIEAGRHDQLAFGLLRLLELHSRYATNIASPAAPKRTLRVGTLLPSSRNLTEIDWTIMQDPDASGFNGQRLLTGALVRHPDGNWGIHT
jgi:hypothetical protein